jgi:glutamyl-tRNA synthetase
LFNWLWARKTGGTFVLRIEDTDQERSTPESRQIIFDSLRWLGIDWDEGPEKGGDHGPYTQMERLGLYKEWADKLIAEGKAFRCYCTKEELQAQREALKAKDPKAEFKYPGTCRTRSDQPDLPYVVRFKVPKDGAITYRDMVFGEVKTPNAAQQDFVLLRSDGIPLYNFGCVVDDITMNIGIVARGRDHMVNTPPQIMLYEAFGAKVPAFAHLPMMLNQKGAKLSKRDGAVGVFEYRDAGYAPEAVLNYLVRFGWSHGDQEVFSKTELVEAFNWEACGRGDGRFDPKKFLAINQEHLKAPRLMPEADYVSRTLPFIQARGLAAPSAERLAGLVPMIRDRATTFVDAAERLDFVFRAELQMDEAAQKKILVPAAAPVLEGLAAALDAVSDWAEAPLEAAADAFVAAQGLAMKDVAQPARVALTGKSASPGPYQVMVALGRDLTLSRVRAGAALAAAAS